MTISILTLTIFVIALFLLMTVSDMVKNEEECKNDV